jgi:hypothetical protein
MRCEPLAILVNDLNEQQRTGGNRGREPRDEAAIGFLRA